MQGDIKEYMDVEWCNISNSNRSLSAILACLKFRIKNIL